MEKDDISDGYIPFFVSVTAINSKWHSQYADRGENQCVKFPSSQIRRPRQLFRPRDGSGLHLSFATPYSPFWVPGCDDGPCLITCDYAPQKLFSSYRNRFRSLCAIGRRLNLKVYLKTGSTRFGNADKNV